MLPIRHNVRISRKKTWAQQKEEALAGLENTKRLLCHTEEEHRAFVDQLKAVTEKAYNSVGSHQRNTALSQATPSWVDKKWLAEIYRWRAPGEHIDHIVPLQGRTVCGLYVPWNLVAVDKHRNLKKSNKHDPDQFFLPASIPHSIARKATT